RGSPRTGHRRANRRAGAGGRIGPLGRAASVEAPCGLFLSQVRSGDYGGGVTGMSREVIGVGVAGIALVAWLAARVASRDTVHGLLARILRRPRVAALLA